MHLVRASLRYVSSTDAKAVVAALKAIYQSAKAEEALRELDAFDDAWGAKYKAVARLWRGNWENIIPFFQFLPEIRKVIYTTNAIESLNMVMRKYTRNRAYLPERRFGPEIVVHGDPGSVEELEGDPSLEAGIAELPGDVR